MTIALRGGTPWHATNRNRELQTTSGHRPCLITLSSWSYSLTSTWHENIQTAKDRIWTPPKQKQTAKNYIWTPPMFDDISTSWGYSLTFTWFKEKQLKTTSGHCPRLMMIALRGGTPWHATNRNRELQTTSGHRPCLMTLASWWYSLTSTWHENIQTAKYRIWTLPTFDDVSTYWGYSFTSTWPGQK